MNGSRLARLLLVSSFLFACCVRAAAPYQVIGDIGAGHEWSGGTATAEGAALPIPGEAVFRQPDGSRDAYKHGFRTETDGTLDWRGTYGVHCEVCLGGDASVAHEGKSVVKSASAVDADHLRIGRVGGRIQEISIANFTGNGPPLAVNLTEQKDGKTLRSEESTTATVSATAAR